MNLRCSVISLAFLAGGVVGVIAAAYWPHGHDGAERNAVTLRRLRAVVPPAWWYFASEELEGYLRSEIQHAQELEIRSGEGEVRHISDAAIRCRLSRALNLIGQPGSRGRVACEMIVMTMRPRGTEFNICDGYIFVGGTIASDDGAVRYEDDRSAKVSPELYHELVRVFQ